MRIYIFLAALTAASFSYAEEPSFKFTFGSNLGKIPIEINSIDKNKKNSMGLKMNKWILSPNFSSAMGNKNSLDFLNKKNKEDKLYIKINIKF